MRWLVLLGLVVIGVMGCAPRDERPQKLRTAMAVVKAGLSAASVETACTGFRAVELACDEWTPKLGTGARRDLEPAMAGLRKLADGCGPWSSALEQRSAWRPIETALMKAGVHESKFANSPLGVVLGGGGAVLLVAVMWWLRSRARA